MCGMKPINTSIFDFPTLLAKGCVYVGENLPVYYVGVNYNPAADVRTIDDARCERADADVGESDSHETT